MKSLLDAVEIRSQTAAQTTATSAVNGAAVQVNGESVAFMASAGTINAGNYLCAQYSADGSTGWTDIAGSRVQFPANDKPAVVEIIRPTTGYVRPVIIRAGATTTTSAIFQFRYEPLAQPANNNLANEITSEAWLSPAAGTA